MTNAITVFALFTRLPVELRLKIWEHTLRPRIVEVFIKGHLLQSEDDASVEEKPASNNLTQDQPSTFQPTQQPTGVRDGVAALLTDPAGSSAVDASMISEPGEISTPDIGPDTEAATSLFEIENDPESDGESEKEVEATRLIYVSSSAVPPILHTCRESRIFGLQIYTLRFGTAASPPRIYFNDSLDTLFLPYWCFDQGSSTFAKTVARYEPFTVQHVAFEIDKWYSDWRDDYVNYQIEPLRFQHLKDITFLESQPHPDGQCSCCFDPERPAELGHVGFAISEEGSIWPENVGKACQERFKEMVKEYPDFNPPAVNVMALTRNGIRI